MPARDTPHVKICGVARLEDAMLASSLGAWCVGMVFYPRSPRRCHADEASAIGAALRRRSELCGVFVNAKLDHIADVVERAGLTIVQLHGDEGPAYCAEVARRTGAKVTKAVRVRSRADVLRLEPYHTDFHLLDSGGRGLRGGSGETFDWSLARHHPGSTPVIVGGGLDPGNVGEAIAATRPFAVDVASGVEAEPGVKDPAKLEAFFAAVREGRPSGAAADAA